MKSIIPGVFRGEFGQDLRSPLASLPQLCRRPSAIGVHLGERSQYFMKGISENPLTVPPLELRCSAMSNTILLSTADVGQPCGLDLSIGDECSDIFFEISRCDSFASPCAKIRHHLIRKLLLIKGQILHLMDIRLDLPRPLYLD